MKKLKRIQIKTIKKMKTLRVKNTKTVKGGYVGGWNW